MRVLVIYCHPVETSFAAALHRATLEGLAAAGHEAVDLDLYQEAFDPVLSRQERLDYRDTSRNTAAVGDYVAQLRAVQGVVIVHPTWWYGAPALLKGYFDRVWVPGVAFDITSKGDVVAGPLRHIRHIAVVTTYGSPWWLIRLYLGDPHRKVMQRGCRFDWYAKYNMDHSTPRTRAAFLARVHRGMARFR